MHHIYVAFEHSTDISNRDVELEADRMLVESDDLKITDDSLKGLLLTPISRLTFASRKDRTTSYSSPEKSIVFTLDSKRSSTLALTGDDLIVRRVSGDCYSVSSDGVIVAIVPRSRVILIRAM